MIRPLFFYTKNMHPWSLSLLLLACGPGPDNSEQSCDTGASALPAVGSPCGTEGQICNPDDPCSAQSLQCKGGVWTEQGDPPGPDCTTTGPTTGTTGTSTTTGPTTGTTTTTEPETTTTSETTGGAVACDPNDLPPEGSACANEGEFCSPGCTDQCQFCNIVQCTGGTWQSLEAPPAPCLDCAEICPFTTAPMCPGGAPDDEACILGCEDSKMGRCASEFSALRACAGLTPEFSCDLDGRPVVAGCEAQFDAFYACAL